VRALVVGASGQVGFAVGARLRERGWDVVGTYGHVALPGLQPLDIGDAGAVERLIGSAPFECVFFPAALTTVDFCEDHQDEAMRLNRDAPAAAARAATKQGARFVYYSTEYVFDGTRGPYAEDDAPHPVSVYGRSKLEGERAVLDENAAAVVIRTTVAYGPEPQGKNFVYQLLRRGRARETMRVPMDQVSSPTYNGDLAAASVELAERGLTGLFHVAGSSIVDRYAFARLACEVFGLDTGLVHPVATAELGQKAARPLRAGLRIERARGALATELRGAREGLVAMRQALAAAAS
jgi:dTDP-4-dehydrorhamnose reductase